MLLRTSVMLLLALLLVLTSCGGASSKALEPNPPCLAHWKVCGKVNVSESKYLTSTEFTGPLMLFTSLSQMVQMVEQGTIS